MIYNKIVIGSEPATSLLFLFIFLDAPSVEEVLVNERPKDEIKKDTCVAALREPRILGENCLQFCIIKVSCISE